jgi:hypothetical protein
MTETAAGYQAMLIDALVISAKRGGFQGDLPGMVGRLSSWIRADFAGTTNAKEWDDLMQEASQLFNDWYDWYSRIYTRPNGLLNGMSIDEWIAS